MLNVLNADGIVLVSNDDYANGGLATRVFWLAPASDPYYVEVASYLFGTGTYTLTIAASTLADDYPNAIGLELSVVTTSGPVQGAIDYVTDVDLFSLEAESGQVFRIDVALGTLRYSVLRVLGEDRSPLATNNDYPGGEGASRLLWEVPSDGTYYLEVSATVQRPAPAP